MKNSTSFIIVASALIGLVGTSMPLYAQEANHLDVYSMCSKETKHSTLYDYGKRLAEGWVYWTKTEAKEEKKYPVRTKSSFFTRAMLGYTKKYKIADTNIVYFCFMGYNSVIKENPWSSVHQGLVDYLPAQSKSRFLSLPEQ